MTIHVNRPDSRTTRHYRHCPTCWKRRRFVATHYVWYDTIWTCLGCGDSWTSEGRGERPFRPRWRDESRARARKAWAGAVTQGEFRSWLSRELDLLRAPLTTTTPEGTP